MLDYKDIIIKHYALKMSGRKIASHIGASKSGVNEFLKAFEECEKLQYPLPPGITNYGIAMLVYGNVPGTTGRNENIELPDYAEIANLMATRKNMTLVFLWNRYKQKSVRLRTNDSISTVSSVSGMPDGVKTTTKLLILMLSLDRRWKLILPVRHLK